MKHNKYIIYFNESKKMAENLGLRTKVPLFEIEILGYSFGEFSVKLPPIPENGDIYFLIQHNGNPSDVLMRVMMTLDTLENMKPHRVNLIIPYLPFSRQDKKRADNRAVASRVVANILNNSYISNIFTFDLHNPVIAEYFKTPVYNLTMLDSFVSYFQSLDLENVVIVAPDHGRFNAAKYVASAFKDASFVLINKERTSTHTVEIKGIEGDTKGKTALIIEDIIDTGNTLVSAVTALKEQGVKEVYVAATHGVLSYDALAKIKALGLKKIIITNTINQKDDDEILEILPIEDHLVTLIND